MNRNWMKRTLSLLLALVLLVGNVPVAAFATEEVAEETVAEICQHHFLGFNTDAFTLLLVVFRQS